MERGDALRLLEQQAGIRPAEVNHIVRQRGVYRKAVAALDKGELTECVQRLDEMGAIKEIEDAGERGKALTTRYMEAVQAGKSALIVSPTHAEGKAVTGHVREALKAAGRIGKDDTAFTRLGDRQWTDAQKADAARYEVGDVIQFTQHCPGVPARDMPPAPAGLRAKVISTDADKKLVVTEDAAGHRRLLPLGLSHRFGVFRRQELGLTTGDTIRITKNAYTLDGRHKLSNGAIYKVKGFTEEGHIRLDNRGKWVVSKHMGHLNHGYCTTAQAAQGKSVDECIGALPAASLTASSLRQLNVILSRGRKGVTLLTDRRTAFIDAMARLHKTRLASELFEPAGASARKARQQRQMEHAREVSRLKAFERARRHRQQQMRDGQQRTDARQHERQQQAQQKQQARTGRAPQPKRSSGVKERRRPPRPDRGGPSRGGGPAKER